MLDKVQSRQSHVILCAMAQQIVDRLLVATSTPQCHQGSGITAFTKAMAGSNTLDSTSHKTLLSCL